MPKLVQLNLSLAFKSEKMSKASVLNKVKKFCAGAYSEVDCYENEKGFTVLELEQKALVNMYPKYFCSKDFIEENVFKIGVAGIRTEYIVLEQLPKANLKYSVLGDF